MEIPNLNSSTASDRRSGLHCKVRLTIALSAFMLGLVGCQSLGMQMHSGSPEASQAYREAMRQALALTEAAREQGDPAKYIASAELIEQADDRHGPSITSDMREERTRAVALGVLNYVRAGDVARAQSFFARLEEAGSELYFEDGASVRDTLRVLVGLADLESEGALSLVNIKPAHRAEIRRTRASKH